MSLPDSHYHVVEDQESIALCETEGCNRRDGVDLYGNTIRNLSEYKMVKGFRDGELIPITARYLSTVINKETIHYYEINGADLN